jgi:hypothetical protein
MQAAVSRFIPNLKERKEGMEVKGSKEKREKHEEEERWKYERQRNLKIYNWIIMWTL